LRTEQNDAKIITKYRRTNRERERERERALMLVERRWKVSRESL
jgi:hypothetical protein